MQVTSLVAEPSEYQAINCTKAISGRSSPKFLLPYEDMWTWQKNKVVVGKALQAEGN